MTTWLWTMGEKIFAGILFVVMVASLVFLMVMVFMRAHRDEVHTKAINDTVTFGERHECVDFVLKKGECLRVNSENGELVLCLPKDGKPEVRVSPVGDDVK